MSYDQYYQLFIRGLNFTFIGPFPPNLELLILPQASSEFFIAEINGIPNINMEKRLEANLFAELLKQSFRDLRNFPSREERLFIEREIIVFRRDLIKNFQQGADALEAQQLEVEPVTLPFYFFSALYTSGLFKSQNPNYDYTNPVNRKTIAQFRLSLPNAIRIIISPNGIKLLEAFTEYPPLNR